MDEQTIEEFERDFKRNLYRVWNRMSSGSYFPPPVRTVMIPKAKGGKRTGYPDGRRSGRASGREESIRATGGTVVPSQLLRLSAGEVGAGCSGAGHGSDAGPLTGSVTWTSRGSSTISITT